MKQPRVKEVRHFMLTDHHRQNNMFMVELFLAQNKENNKEEK